MMLCPACGARTHRTVFVVSRCTVRESASFRDAGSARAGPFGRIELQACSTCGFVWNSAFEEQLATFDETFEFTQTASPAFNRFHEELALDLDRRLGGLAGRHVVEIGCGQGEFLGVICPRVGARGTGFDPVLRPSTSAPPGVTLHKALYGPANAPEDADLVVHSMTLEHQPAVADHLGMIRATLGERSRARLFVMIPDFAVILDQRAFWTVHYEHCSYLTPGTLARALRRAGFRLESMWRVFGEQFLCALAAPDTDAPSLPARLPLEESPTEVVARIEGFAADVESDRAGWDRRFGAWAEAKRRVVLWGAASRTVAFVQAVGQAMTVQRIVDVNSAKRGCFLPGSGHPIVHPDELVADPPDVVVVMSPVYTDEIRGMLATRGLRPEIVRVDDRPGVLTRDGDRPSGH